MAVLNRQDIVLTGLVPTYAAGSAGGDSVANDSKTFLHFKSTAGGAIVVTIASVQNCSFGFDHDAVVSIPGATGDKMIGSFPKNRFDDANGRVAWTYDTNPPTGLTVGAFRLP